MYRGRDIDVPSILILSLADVSKKGTPQPLAISRPSCILYEKNARVLRRFIEDEKRWGRKTMRKIKRMRRVISSLLSSSLGNVQNKWNKMRKARVRMRENIEDDTCDVTARVFSKSHLLPIRIIGMICAVVELQSARFLSCVSYIFSLNCCASYRVSVMENVYMEDDRTLKDSLEVIE